MRSPTLNQGVISSPPRLGFLRHIAFLATLLSLTTQTQRSRASRNVAILSAANCTPASLPFGYRVRFMTYLTSLACMI